MASETLSPSTPASLGVPRLPLEADMRHFRFLENLGQKARFTLFSATTPRPFRSKSRFTLFSATTSRPFRSKSTFYHIFRTKKKKKKIEEEEEEDKKKKIRRRRRSRGGVGIFGETDIILYAEKGKEV